MSASDTPSSPPPRRERLRWTRRFVLAVVLLCAAVLTVAVAAWVLFGDRIAERAAFAINRSVFDPASTRLRAGRVSGFPLTGLRLEDVVLELREGDTWFPFLRADEMVARYRLLALLEGRYRIRDVEADRLHVEVRRDAAGDYLLPGTRAGGDGGGEPFGFAIERIRVHDGYLLLDLPEVTAEVSRLEGELGFAFGDGGVDLELRGIGGTLNDSLGVVRVASGGVEVREGVMFDAVRGRWDDAVFRLEGTPAGMRGGPRDLDLEVERLDLARLGALLDRDDLDPGRVARAAGHLGSRGDDLTFRGAGSARWEDWRFEDAEVRGVLTDSVLELEGSDVTLFGTRFTDGRLRMPREGTGLEIEARFEELRSDSLSRFEWAELVPGTYSGRGRLRFGDRTRPELDLEVGLDLGAGHVHQVPFEAAGLRLRGRGGAWTLDSLEVRLARGLGRASGAFSEDSLDLVFRYRGDLRPLRQLVRVDDLTGNGLITGRLTGPPDAAVLESRGTLLSLGTSVLFAPRVELVRGAGVVGAGRHLEIEFRSAVPFSLAGIPVDRGQGAVTVEEDRVLMDGLSLARGDTLIEVSGALTWEPAVRVEVDRARLDLGGRRVETMGPAVLTWDGTTVTGDSLDLRTPRGTLEGWAAYRPEDSFLAAALRVTDLDPAWMVPRDAGLPVTAERITGRVELLGAIPILDGRADLRMEGVSLGTARLDSLSASVEVDDRTVSVHRIRARRGEGSLEARGSVRMPAPLYTVLEAEVFGPDLPADSTLWSLDAEVRDVELGDWLGFLRRDRRPLGGVSATGRLRGSSASPEVELDLAARGLTWRDFYADSLVFRGRVAGGSAEIRALDLWQRGTPFHVEGRFPVDLSFKPLAGGVAERPIDLTVASEGGSLENLQLTPWVDAASGRLEGRARVFGTPAEPLVEGEVRVRDGTVVPADRDEVLEEVNAWILFDRDLVRVTAAEARMGGGMVSARGTYRLHARDVETYRLLVTARDAVVLEKGRYGARADADLVLEPRRAEDGRIYPFAEGQVSVDRAEYIGALQPQDIARFEPQPILYDVNVTAPARVFVVSGDVDVELAADLRVRQEPDRRVIFGTAEILQGTYRLFLRKFRITEGTITWSDPNSLLPEMDVTAETTDRNALILVRWTGRADEPVIEFSARSLETGEDLGLSDEEVIRRLAIGSLGLSTLGLVDPDEGGDAEGSGLEAPLQAVALGASLFVRQVEQALLERVGIFDDVTIAPDYEGDSPDFRIEVRKWFTPELSLRYETGISRYFDQDLALEYRLRRSLILRGESVRRRDEEAGITQEYNLDIKIRHEY